MDCKHSGAINLTIFLFGTLVLALTGGCADTPSWGGWSDRPSVARLQMVQGNQANWVYYPEYEIYYSPNYQQYVYWDAVQWVTRLEPMAPVTPEKLQATLSIAMPFHDSPEKHHAVVVQSYPPSSRAAGAASLVSSRN